MREIVAHSCLQGFRQPLPLPEPTAMAPSLPTIVPCGCSAINAACVMPRPSTGREGAMESGMFPMRQHLQVLNAVIVHDHVAMMHVLCRGKVAPEVGFHHEPMGEDIALIMMGMVGAVFLDVSLGVLLDAAAPPRVVRPDHPRTSAPKDVGATAGAEQPVACLGDFHAKGEGCSAVLADARHAIMIGHCDLLCRVPCSRLYQQRGGFLCA